MHAVPATKPPAKRHRPGSLTVLVAAFVAGGAAAVGINRALDVHLAQRKPRVESEPIFVALRSLPQGSPVTVWDVALRDWPKAMLPTTAMRAEDTFEGCVLRHPLREGQPLLSIQLVRAASQADPAGPPGDVAFVPPIPHRPATRIVEADLWTPATADQTPLSPPSPPAAGPEPAAVSQLRDIQPWSPPPTAVAAPAVAAAGPAPAVTDSTAPDTSASVGVEPLPAVADPPPVITEAVPVPGPEMPVVDDSTPPAIERTPVASVAEPTLAEPATEEPTPAENPLPPDAALPSVVVAQSVTTPAVQPPTTAAVGEPFTANAPPATAPQGSPPAVTRYLVVPERIALQVDAGFVEPAPAATTPPQVSPAAQPAATPQARSRSAPTASRPGQPPAADQRAVRQRPAAPTRTASPPRQPAAQPTRQQRQPAASGSRQATNSGPRGLGAMFPNIAAGIDAITGGRQARPTDERYEEAVATDDPAYRP